MKHYDVRKKLVNSFDKKTGNLYKKNIVIIGRSHAEDIWLSLNINQELFKEYNFLFLEFDFRCFDNQKFKKVLLDKYAKKFIWKTKNSCEYQIDTVLKKLDELSPYKLIFSPRWSKLVDLKKINEVFRKYEKNIIYMNRTPSFTDVPTVFLMSKDKELFLESSLNYSDKSVSEINSKIKKFVNKTDSSYFDRYSIVCPKNNFCNLISNDKLLITDKDHYSIEGFKIFGKKMFNNNISDLFN